MGQDAPYRVLARLPPRREKVETLEILRETNNATADLAELEGFANIISNQPMLVSAIVFYRVF